MKKIKKGLTLTSVIAICGAVALLIGAIFGLEVFSGYWLSLLLTFGTVALASGFAINSVNYIKVKRVVSIICLSLLGFLTVCALVIFWAKVPVGNWFSKVTCILALATVFFNIIMSLYIQLGDKQKALQIVTYILVAVIDIFLTVVILGINLFKYNGVWQTFGVACLVVLALLCTLAVLSKKNYTNVDAEMNAMGDEYIQVRKSEYNELKARVAELEDQLKQYKK